MPARCRRRLRRRVLVCLGGAEGVGNPLVAASACAGAVTTTRAEPGWSRFSSGLAGLRCRGDRVRPRAGWPPRISASGETRRGVRQAQAVESQLGHLRCGHDGRCDDAIAGILVVSERAQKSTSGTSSASSAWLGRTPATAGCWPDIRYRSPDRRHRRYRSHSRCPLACARLRHYGGGQLAVAYRYGRLGDRRDLGYLKRRSARDPGPRLGRILIAEVRE
jgi:hypothetical protein